MSDFIEVETKLGTVNLRLDSVCLIENEKDGWTPVLLSAGERLFVSHDSRVILDNKLHIGGAVKKTPKKRMTKQQMMDAAKTGRS